MKKLFIILFIIFLPLISNAQQQILPQQGISSTQPVPIHGHNSILDGGALKLPSYYAASATAATSSTTINVSVNDVLLICAETQLDYTTSPTYRYVILNFSGTSVLNPVAGNYVSNTLNAVSTTTAKGSVCGIELVTTAGTFQVTSNITISGGTGVVYTANQLQVIYLIRN